LILLGVATPEDGEEALVEGKEGVESLVVAEAGENAQSARLADLFDLDVRLGNATEIAEGCCWGVEGLSRVTDESSMARSEAGPTPGPPAIRSEEVLGSMVLPFSGVEGEEESEEVTLFDSYTDAGAAAQKKKKKVIVSATLWCNGMEWMMM
jgi:hypothetical protein